MAEKTTLIQVDTSALVGIGAAAASLKGLSKVLSSITDGVKEAFSVKGYQDYLQTVKRFGKELAGQLLVLQLSFGKMKVAIAQAVAPIAAVFVPYLNQAIQAVIRFAGTLRQLFSGLIIGITGNDALADSAQNAADAEENLESAATSAGKAARRSLAGFDELERLNAPTGGGSSSVDMDITPVNTTISPQVQALVDQILALLQPLLAIDLTPLTTSLQNLRNALANLSGVVGSSMEWLWYQVLTPFIAWLLESFAPVMTDAFAAALDLVTAAIAPVMTGMQALWEALQPIISFIGETVVLAIQSWQKAFENLTAVFQEKGPQITAIFQNVGDVISVVWQLIRPVLQALRSQVDSVFTSVGDVVSVVTGTIMDALSGLTGFLAGVFTGDWERSWEGIKDFLKGIINGIIGLLNTMIDRLVSSLNAVIRAANKLSFTVPSWVPGIGGSKFGFNIKTVSAESIPYLARGAVLPANKPFLAMVGDQRHGTNIEAPLATIQEAVSVVMEDHIAAMMAGFEALVTEERRTRQTIEGIHIGDSVIGRAVDRYRSKMAVVNGGIL